MGCIIHLHFALNINNPYSNNLVILTILLLILVCYLILYLIAFFFLNSNIIPMRRFKKHNFSMAVTLNYIPSALDKSKKIAYWEVEKRKQNSTSTNAENSTVILLHGFTRNSATLDKRAQIYYNKGYTIIFIDNLGHGKSSNLLFPSGYRYAIETINIIKTLKLRDPVVHGVSMGGIAAVIIGQQKPNLCKAIICEAVAYNFDNMYKELQRYLRLPSFLFPGIEIISKKIAWRQLKDMDLDYDITKVSIPLFLIHGKKDRLFKYEEHYNKIVELMSSRETFHSWLVPFSGHSKMHHHKKYEEKISEFLNKIK